MRVVLSVDARADLENIADFIAAEDPVFAGGLVLDLDAKARELGEFPKRFPIVPDLAHLDIRRRNYRNYRIFYRVEPDRVLVLRYLHAARDHAILLVLQE